MLRNYLKTALRNLTKRRGYSLLNILGLAIGFTCCLLIVRYVSYERSFDHFEPNADRIYRLRLDSYQQGKLSWQSATSYPAFGPTLKKDFPEIKEYCRLYDANWLLSNEGRQVRIKETQGYISDPSAVDMFGLKIINGVGAAGLQAPDKILLSASTARKYFGDENPVGRQLKARNRENLLNLEVTGVYQDLPANSHLVLHHLISYATLDALLRQGGDSSDQAETSFGWYDFYTYLQLRPGTDPADFESKLPAFCDKYINSREWNTANNVRAEIHLISLKDIHLYSNVNQEAEVNGNGQAVSFLFLIAFFIIAIAWINYINLATARSLERAREVGVRKVAGALRRNLIFQFLTESILLNVIALVLAVGLMWLLTPWFARLTGEELSGLHGFSSPYMTGFLGIFLLGSLLSGIYPAFVLSSFRPVAVLKGIFKNSSGGLLLRKGLIIGQFVTSVVLIAGTIIVYQQVKYMRSQSLGANIDQTLVVKGPLSEPDSVYQDILLPFKNELLQQPAIRSVAASSSVMGEEIYWTNGTRVLRPGSKSVTMYFLGADYDFVPSYQLRLLAGRNFSKDFKTDDKAVILNEKAVELLGFKNPEDALNAFITNGDTMKVVGVIGNYHHMGLQRTIDPTIILLRPDNRNYYSVKMKATNVKSTIKAISGIYKHYFPDDPFSYYFLDEAFDRQYRADRQFGQVFGLFAFLAILIACFGLLGLSAYNILLRTKEIGIRKVLGAPVGNILYILSREFILLVGIAFLLAIPVTWWIMHNWLQDFAYRIDIRWWVFLVAGGLSLLIAVVTIVTQAMKAAMMNPVKSLRSE